MKKILFISAFPPGNKTAGQNYTAQLLKDISSSYEVDLIYWSYPGHSAIVPLEVKVLDEVKLTLWRKVLSTLSLFLLFPLFTARFNLRMLRRLSAIASSYDILYFDFSQVFVYSLFIKHPCKVFMCHDVIAQKFARKRFSGLFLWNVKMTENLLLRTAAVRICFSDKDVDYIRQTYGLESERVSFYLSDLIGRLDTSKIAIEDFYVFYGAWNRPENYEGLIWFCTEVLPHCDIRCVVVGGGMGQEVRNKITSDKVQLTGFVENPYEYIARSSCLIAPLFQGAGVKVKVIESLACGTPVIGTDIAAEGIPELTYGDGRMAMTIVSGAKGFISAINGFAAPSAATKAEIKKAFTEKYSTRDFKTIMKSW